MQWLANLPADVQQQVVTHLRARNLPEAVKTYRTATGAGLAEAKRVVEGALTEMPAPTPPVVEPTSSVRPSHDEWSERRRAQADVLCTVAPTPAGNVAFSWSGDKVVYFSGRTAYLWSCTERRKLLQTPPLSSSIYGFSFSPDEERLVIGLNEQQVICWELCSGKPLWTFSMFKSGLAPLYPAYSPTGAEIYCSIQNGWLTLDAENGRLKGQMFRAGNPFLAPVPSADGSWAAGAHWQQRYDTRIYLSNLPAGPERGAIKVLGDISDLALTSHDRWLACTVLTESGIHTDARKAFRALLSVRSLGESEDLKTFLLPEPGNGYLPVLLLPDAVGTPWNKRIDFWSISTGELKHSLETPGDIRGAKVLGTSRILACTGSGQILFWNFSPEARHRVTER